MSAISYDWRCNVCDTHNPAGAQNCGNCEAPSVISAFEIDARKRAISRGEIFSEDVHLDLPKERTHSWWECVSVGENRNAQRLGKLTITIAIVITPFMVAAYYGKRPAIIEILLFQLAFLYFAWDILKFTQGKWVSVGGIRNEPNPDNTAMRWFGLSFDVFAIYVILYRVVFIL